MNKPELRRESGARYRRTWIWNLANRQFPRVSQIAALYRGAQPLWDLTLSFKMARFIVMPPSSF